jgi:glycosyltransferase involved in cell wall biosynthesis
VRVTFLTQWFDPEPGAIRGLPLARELAKRGFEIEVVTGFPNYPGGNVYPGYRIRPWMRETVDGVSILRVALYPSHDGNPLHRVANYASFALSSAVLGPALTRPADVLYVYHPPPTLGAPAAAFRTLHRVPVVYHIADMWPESAVESGMLGRGTVRDVAESVIGAYCRWVYAQCEAITVLSPGFKRLLVERGVDESKVHIVYNWADDAMFRPLPRNESISRELGLQGRFNFVYAGNLGPLQGLETVIRAAALVRDLPAIQIVLIGTGVDVTHLQKVAAEVRASNVKFIGRLPLERMPEVNALADVLLVHLKDLPFFAATVPSKTQVSLASGRPVLMAVRGDASQIVRDAGAGPVVPPEDPESMAAAFRELYLMPDAARERLGEAGHAFYLREMSLAVGADRMAELFRSVGGSRASYRAPAVGLRRPANAP